MAQAIDEFNRVYAPLEHHNQQHTGNILKQKSARQAFIGNARRSMFPDRNDAPYRMENIAVYRPPASKSRLQSAGR
jgi:hypothetical protein